VLLSLKPRLAEVVVVANHVSAIKSARVDLSGEMKEEGYGSFAKS